MIGRNYFLGGFRNLCPKYVLHQPETYAEDASDSQSARPGKYQGVVDGLSSGVRPQSLRNVRKPDQPRPKMLGSVQAQHQQRVFGGQARYLAFADDSLPGA